MMMRQILALILFASLLSAGASHAQVMAPNPAASTNSTQSLDDILARQRGEVVAPSGSENAAPTQAAPLGGQLGTLGAVSDADVYRAYRDGTAQITSSDPSPAGTTVMQDGGMRWLEFRRGPLPTYGGYLLLGVLAALVLLYVVAGKIRVEGALTGEKISRFTVLERVGHWMMAIPFLLLGVTGLVMLFGRTALIPLLGHEAYSLIALAGKFVHNYVAWVFMAGLVISFLRWALQNFPTKADVVWILKAGGMFTKGSHPPAGKFNAGEKMVFWAVVGFGTLISLTGLSLLFPFQVQVFPTIFQLLNDLGLPQLLGFNELGTALSPQEEMQVANILHSVFAFLLMAIIFAHIYLGTVGMEGALDAITKGEVDVQWAKEHHSIWYDEVKDADSDGGKSPAE